MQTATSSVAERGKDAGKAVRGAGDAIGSAAAKARVPLLAGGAALAGALGGVAISNANGRRGRGLKAFVRPAKPKVQLRTKDLASAARDIGSFGEQVGKLAMEIHETREAAATKGRRRSPIEVVLEGLTARRV